MEQVSVEVLDPPTPLCLGESTSITQVEQDSCNNIGLKEKKEGG